MKIEVSNGEIFDKLSILEIKKVNIHDRDKRENIKNELKEIEIAYRAILLPMEYESSSACLALYHQLLLVNGDLWIIEDKIRRKEAKGEFDEAFIKLAREVYKTNDLRSDIKRKINSTTQSNIVEEKSYADYK